MTNLTTPTFPAVVFSVTDAGIAELEAKHKGLVVAHGDKKGYLALTQAIAEVRTARTDVEKRRKELKRDALDYGRLVDSTAKAITERLEAIEGPLKANKELIDAENERIKRQQEEADRVRREAEAAEQAKRDAEARAQQAELDRQRAELKAAQDALAEQQRKAAEAAQAEADAKARKEAEKAAKAAKAKLDAEIEAARPDREKVIAHVRKCIDEIPGVSTEIGKHYAADVREGLEALLVSWNVEVKEAA